MPEYRGVDGTYPAGKPLPAARARMKIGEIDVSANIPSGAKTVEFTVDLQAGPAQLVTWFLDRERAELCGAFYVEVLRLW